MIKYFSALSSLPWCSRSIIPLLTCFVPSMDNATGSFTSIFFYHLFNCSTVSVFQRYPIEWTSPLSALTFHYHGINTITNKFTAISKNHFLLQNKRQQQKTNRTVTEMNALWLIEKISPCNSAARLLHSSLCLDLCFF